MQTTATGARSGGTGVATMAFEGRVADDDPIWGSGSAADDIHREQHLELIGNRLRASGMAQLGRFRRVTDYVNFLEGFFTLRDVVLLDRAGGPTRITMPELRMKLDDVGIIAQREAQAPAAPTEAGVLLEKVSQRLVIMTRAHLVAGDVFIHSDSSLLHFVDSNDPKFIPMSDVSVRWLDDHELAGRFPFALVQRTQILGVATEGLGGGRDADERHPRARVAQPDVQEPGSADG
jgi:hypothetical protein